MNGLDIVRRVYVRLRRPAQSALPYTAVLDTVSEVIAQKRIDLALSGQNSTSVTSEWFTPPSSDFVLGDIGLTAVMIPTHLEHRGIGDDTEVGEDVPAVHYDVLDTSRIHAVSFYGSPLRISFSDNLDYVTQQEYRLTYESDFEGDVNLGADVRLPAYFMGMVSLEAAYRLLDQINDPSPKFAAFFALADKRWVAQIADNRRNWKMFVKKFKGRARVPKRMFFYNRRKILLPKLIHINDPMFDIDGGLVNPLVTHNLTFNGNRVTFGGNPVIFR